MIDKNVGDAAFPNNPWVNPQSGKVVYQDGMTLRQWYAGMAMQGLIASESDEDGFYSVDDKSQDIAVKRSFELADKMIKEGKK